MIFYEIYIFKGGDFLRIIVISLFSIFYTTLSITKRMIIYIRSNGSLFVRLQHHSIWLGDFALKAHQEDTLKSLHMRDIRAKQDTVYNTSSRKDLHAQHPPITIQTSPSGHLWLGNVRRMKDGRIIYDLLHGLLKVGRRKVGCSVLRFKDLVKRDMKRTGFDYSA